MFSVKLNQLRATLQFTPEAPILIKEGRHLADPARGRDGVEAEPIEVRRATRRSFHRGLTRQPQQGQRRDGKGSAPYDTAEACFDMAFVWSQTAAGPRLYLPGSSLKGVLRRAAERTIARWRPEWAVAGDPFVAAAAHWVEQERKLGRSPSSDAIYRMAGPVERLFGHQALRGRCLVADAWLDDERQALVTVRDGVGISRETGAAASSVKFSYEAVAAGTFNTSLTLVNYELWQLGLLAHALAALDGGMIRIGYGTRRGLGRVRVAIIGLEVRWFGRQPTADGPLYSVPTLASLAELAGLNQGRNYGWQDHDLRLTLPLVPASTDELGPRWSIPGAPGPGTNWLASPWPEVAGLLPQALAAWELPAELAPWLEQNDSAKGAL